MDRSFIIFLQYFSVGSHDFSIDGIPSALIIAPDVGVPLGTELTDMSVNRTKRARSRPGYWPPGRFQRRDGNSSQQTG